MLSLAAPAGVVLAAPPVPSAAPLKLEPLAPRPKIELAHRSRDVIIQLLYGDELVDLGRDFRLTALGKKGKRIFSYSGPELEDLRRSKKCREAVLQRTSALQRAVPFCAGGLSLKDVDVFELQLGPKQLNHRGLYISAIEGGVPVVVVVF